MGIIEYPTGVALEERVGGGGSNDIHSSCDQRLWFSTIRESICVMEKFKLGDENIEMTIYIIQVLLLQVQTIQSHSLLCNIKLTSWRRFGSLNFNLCEGELHNTTDGRWCNLNLNIPNFKLETCFILFQ